MPKTDIDYSNTIIYKITCKNQTVTDVYVGHTTNFVQRKHSHKQSCLNDKSPNHNCKVYQVIRANGGWTNWKMEIINFFNCADHYAARKKEQEYFIALNATLNSIEPLPKPKFIQIKNIKKTILHEKPLYFCNTCSVDCHTPKSLEEHNKTNKHKKMEDTEKHTKKTPNFICECCDFKCSKKGDYNRHLLTPKHQKMSTVTVSDKNTYKYINQCNNCLKIYKSRNGLWLHSKKCKKTESEPIIEKTESEIKALTNLVLELVKSNTDLQKQMMDVCKNNNSVIANNSYNKTFNMQFFLNEQCKDAMNLMDFVNSMTLELSDLEDVGKLGYVEGISNIIIKNLNALDIYKRPIHCSDAKREIMYVKDDNVWEKETSNNDRLRKAIKRVTYKNSALLVPWSQKYPACMNNQHHLNDVYVQMMGQAMGGKEEFVDSENKIMKKIAKAVLIDKINL